MAEPTPAPPTPPSLWARLKAWPRSLSLAARAAWAIFGVLLVGVIVVWIIYFVDADNMPYRDWMSWSRMVAILALVVVIPVVAYYGLRLWLEGDAARYPDIDFAWKSGLEALRRAGLKIDGSPLFLVVGSPSPQEVQNLMEASGMTFRVAGVPEESSPLVWYGNPDGIWLCCTDVGWLSALAGLAERKLKLGPVSEDWTFSPALNAPASPQTASRSPLTESTVLRPEVAQAFAQGGTIMLDEFVRQQPVTDRPMPGPQQTASVAPAVPPAIVPPQDATGQSQRLEYLCQLLRLARQPLCAVNGVITLVSFEQMLATAPEIEEVQRAIKSDLLTIQRGLILRCPVTALVVGMERERGFRELVRRVGPERAIAQRFGRRFDLRSECSPDSLVSFTSHVGGVFEDWIYALFRENQALSRPGNTRLYGLLCKVRCNVKPKLGEILAGGFGYNPRQTPHDDPFFFSGCYFAATGGTADRRAFVKGVLEKLLEEQENVEWSRQALADEQRSMRFFYLGVLVGLGLCALLVGMIVRQWL